MEFNELPKAVQKKVLILQKSELTAHHIYDSLSKKVQEGNNAQVLKEISQEELKSYKNWKSITNKEMKPSKFTVWFFLFISKFLGLTFSIKLLESNERRGEEKFEYNLIKQYYPDEIKALQDHIPHEDRLIQLLDESRVELMGSITLGLNDALVELTGTLAGFTLALNNNSIIALTGLIMGFAASLSMGASEYLSNKTEGGENPLRSAYYTGGAYVFAVIFLVLPFFIFSEPIVSITATILTALVIILVFTYYISVVKDYNFKTRFIEMASISLGVAAISFFIGFLVQLLLGVDVGS